MLLFTLLVSPLLVSTQLGNETTIQWLLQSSLVLALTLYLLSELFARIKPQQLRAYSYSTVITLIALFQLGRALSFYFQGESYNTQFFFHLETDNAIQAWRAYLLVLFLSAGYLLLTPLCAYFQIRHRKSHTPINSYALLFCLLVVLVFEPEVARVAKWQSDLQRYAGQIDRFGWDQAQLLSHALNPGALENTALEASPGKNLVLIYLESLEATYMNEDIFGNLTPNIRHYYDQGLTFPEMLQTEGTGYTMAGIVASQCGTPMLFETVPSGNDILRNGFLNRVRCLSDVLAQGGYQQVFMGGAALAFAGKGAFLKAHHYDEVLGRSQLEAELENPQYVTGWGLYDDSLFSLARDRFTTLADSGKPFNLTLLTLDTHHPFGEASASCAPFADSDNTMLNAVHCSDQLLKRFIDDISKHPAWSNTIVALVSDHYAMRNAASEYYPAYSERRLLFTILNSDQSQSITTPGALMDIAPTILTALQVQSNAEFIAGNSLLTSAETLNSDKLRSSGRGNLLRYINSRVLTQRETSLCKAPALLVQNKNQLNIAGQTLGLSHLGQLLPESALQDNYSFVALLDSEGYLESSMVVPNTELGNTLYKYYQRNFISLGKSSALPGYLLDKLHLQAGSTLVALSGNMLGSIRQLDITEKNAQLSVDTDNCSALLATFIDEPALSLSETFMDEFCAQENNSSHLAADNQTLDLEKVLYKNNWFSARLRRNDEGLYEPVQYGQIEPPTQFFCSALLDEEFLLVPGIRSNGNKQLLRLARLPGETLLFRPLF